MTIKQAREFARMTQQDVEDEIGVPRRTLQNWEAETRECPAYVEKWLVKELVQSVQYAQVRWETDYVSTEGAEPRKGFSCWLNDPDSEEMNFCWFFPCDDKGMVNQRIIWEIGRLVEAGWKVHFIG
jgi:DNA-binding XRE family transcriptional regulator